LPLLSFFSFELADAIGFDIFFRLILSLRHSRRYYAFADFLRGCFSPQFSRIFIFAIAADYSLFAIYASFISALILFAAIFSPFSFSFLHFITIAASIRRFFISLRHISYGAFSPLFTLRFFHYFRR